MSKLSHSNPFLEDVLMEKEEAINTLKEIKINVDSLKREQMRRIPTNPNTRHLRKRMLTPLELRLVNAIKAMLNEEMLMSDAFAISAEREAQSAIAEAESL